MQKLIIDIGNSSAKLAVFDNDICQNVEVVKHSDDNQNLINHCRKLSRDNNCMSVIMSSVRNDKAVFEQLKSAYTHAVYLTHYTPVPIQNLYHTPETLGKDRLAAAVGANFLFPNRNVLIFDAGTALTVDFVNDKNQYVGGNISPGLHLRFKALNAFTEKLPLVEISENVDILGTDTLSAISNGVQNGILYETDAYIDNFKARFKDLIVIFTGGDLFFFEKNLKNNIFAQQKIVLTGLNRILDYNV